MPANRIPACPRATPWRREERARAAAASYTKCASMQHFAAKCHATLDCFRPTTNHCRKPLPAMHYS